MRSSKSKPPPPPVVVGSTVHTSCDDRVPVGEIERPLLAGLEVDEPDYSYESTIPCVCP
jgi:hypothetical protein